jgi:antitoxin PrlF
MKSVLATVTSKGQVTLPAEVRKHLGVGQGSRVAFVLDDTGQVRIEVPQYPTVVSLRGAAGSLGDPLPWSEVQATIREERAARRLTPTEARGRNGDPQKRVEG